MDKLVENVVQWAKDKDLLKEENRLKQFTKVAEEFGEIAAGLARNDESLVRDAIGDTVVTLIILAEQSGLTIEECLQEAWDEIKDRKGQTINGAFVKAEDLKS
jgi:NTP pyrophosphatase (non-canonical NTP hydrolase)